MTHDTVSTLLIPDIGLKASLLDAGLCASLTDAARLGSVPDTLLGADHEAIF